MKVNIAWITECFCSGVIVVNELKVDNKLIFVTTNCLWFYEHELLVVFTNTNRANNTNLEPTALLLKRFIYIRSIRLIRVRFNPYLVFFQITSCSWSPFGYPCGFFFFAASRSTEVSPAFSALRVAA